MSFASLDFSDISAWVHPAEPHCSRPATGAGGWVPPFPLQSLLSPQQCFSGNKVKPCIQRESQCNLWNTSTWFKKCFQIHFEQRWKTVRTAVHLCFSAYVLLSRLCFIRDILGNRSLCKHWGHGHGWARSSSIAGFRHTPAWLSASCWPASSQLPLLSQQWRFSSWQISRPDDNIQRKVFASVRYY